MAIQCENGSHFIPVLKVVFVANYSYFMFLLLHTHVVVENVIII